MKPEERQGLTTEEVSKVLGTSTSLVERLFDQGILAGWKHPVTGVLMIDPESIEALKTLKQNITTVTQKEDCHRKEKENVEREDIIATIENRDQAQAMSDFLWNELQRHRGDPIQIEADLKTLEEKWNVTPRMKGRT